MDWKKVFDALLFADGEGAVTDALDRFGLLADEFWAPFGENENNFSTISNQQTDAGGAMVEKVINAIDAMLMSGAFAHGVDPEGRDAPKSMADAAGEFYGIRDGRLENLTPTERTQLAQKIQLIAVGERARPSYLLVDEGEGQTPADFPETFLSLSKSNKLRIPFVQGKFNAGGTGVLQFCGHENYQLIVSRRDPRAPRRTDDESGDSWGFTLVRRLLPSGGRKNSMYVYLAVDGRVPSFQADEVKALPGESTKRKAPVPYREGITHGTIVKLYSYGWRARSIATTDARWELERILHAPCLPFRVVETRNYKANYYATTVSGVWVRVREGEGDESSDIEGGFPGYCRLDVDSIGSLPCAIAVFREDVDARRIPTGVFFTLNGQAHGSLPRDFVSREGKLDYIAKHTLISIDCTHMNERVREDFFMSSRDRLRRDAVYEAISEEVRRILLDHPGLKELNARRRAQRLEEALQNETESMEAFQDLIRTDPALASLFTAGERLVTSIGPATNPLSFSGREFPSYFRLTKEPAAGLVKECQVNRKCRIDFETDAQNDYFDRAISPGSMAVSPEGVLASRRLWNGDCVTYFRPPRGTSPGDKIEVTVAVTDDERGIRGGPFTSRFRIVAVSDQPRNPGGGQGNGHKNRGKGRAAAPTLAMPTIIEVRRDEWDQHEMTPHHAVRIKGAGDDEAGYDFYINMDNAFLITEIRRNRAAERPILEYWFKFGLALAALSMLKTPSLNDDESVEITREVAETASAGFARVIIPVVRRLHEGPLPSPERVSSRSE